jgi:DNA-binding NtrC family response regulator
MRVGATSTLEADVRVVAASNRDLAQAVAEGVLREDLFWRLDVFPIALPPLRQRKEDIGLLAAHLLEQIGQQEGVRRMLGANTLGVLLDHDWPGNVRELRNVLKRAWVLSEGACLAPDLIATLLRRMPPTLGGHWAGTARSPLALGAAAPSPADAGLTGEGRSQAGGWLSLPLGISLADADRRLVEATLRHHGQHREQAAATLGISLKTLYNRLRSYGAA